MNSFDRNLSKKRRRYVENTKKKQFFSFLPPKLINIIILFQLLFYYFPQEAHFEQKFTLMDHQNEWYLVMTQWKYHIYSNQEAYRKGVANNASKAYEFSPILPYSDIVQSQLQFVREGKTILPKNFHMIMFPLLFQIHNLKKRTKSNNFMEMKMNFNWIRIHIQSLLPILGLSGLKRLLRKMGT